MLEDAVAFAGVAKYPARVKCALLGWMAWKDAAVRASIQRTAGHMTDDGTERRPQRSDADVVDPELGINVVDLGLVYGITVDESNTAVIDMTLTSAACPLTDVIEDQTQWPQSLRRGVRINWVWMPPVGSRQDH